MTDYSSDSSTSSVESIASHAEESLEDLERDVRQREMEDAIDSVMRYDDGSYKYPFDRIRHPFVAIDKGMRRTASMEDVEKRLKTREQKIWRHLWTSAPIHEVSNKYLDTDAQDALVEVGFRAAGGIHGDIGIMYSVVCALLDARY